MTLNGGNGRTWLMPTIVAAVAFAAGISVGALVQDPVFVSPAGTELRMLLDEARLGGTEVEIGEITFPAGTDSGDHAHGSTEIFYVLSGELEHIVDGRSTILKPGMAGSVRPPQRVRHRVGAAGPAKALVIWAPGGEAARITARWKQRE